VALSTDTRQELTQWLRDQGLPAHASVPATVSLPSVILVPDIDQTLTALPTTVNVERVDPPQLDNLGAQGAAYVAEITTTLQVEKG